MIRKEHIGDCMSATHSLREDHIIVRRISNVARRYSDMIYSREYVPVEDVKKVLILIELFIDAYHHCKEECSYFPAVKGTMLEDEARALMVEHELGRRVARMLNANLDGWLERGYEPVARMLKAYADYLDLHMEREERFFSSYDAIVAGEEQSKIMDGFYAIRRERMDDGRLRRILLMLDELEHKLAN